MNNSDVRDSSRLVLTSVFLMFYQEAWRLWASFMVGSHIRLRNFISKFSKEFYWEWVSFFLGERGRRNGYNVKESISTPSEMITYFSEMAANYMNRFHCSYCLARYKVSFVSFIHWANQMLTFYLVFFGLGL